MESTCYNGGDIAGAIFGTLVAVVAIAALGYWLYKKKLSKKKELHLVKKDPECADDNYAFDNPAFKGDITKTGSPLDPKWTPKLNGQRKAMDDSYAGSPPPRIVPLRGSDFTGLGIELFGGMKEGIYVKKVMPQGPAAGNVNQGDRIMSITIDFRHIVQEDAMTILSYASPYNVQLELVDGKGVIGMTSSPKSGRSTLTHPLYRSSSQIDVNTIERNARKNIFPDEVDRASPDPKVTIQKENEKKSSLSRQVKDYVTEKFQKHAYVERTKSDESQEKKGLKFGIRVLPPAVNEKLFGKSPSKMQADNENNMNLERNEVTFERQGSINSSGIRRDENGIPQEVPDHMMNAAMAAKENRKSVTINADVRKGKGKAPIPPPSADDPDCTTASTDTIIDMDMTDHAKQMVEEAIQSATEHITRTTGTKFEYETEMKESNTSTPRSEKKRLSSDTESQMAHESDAENSSDGNRIELNSSDITVHQVSEEESDDGRRTHSLGDLSNKQESNSGTLERAQSLDITESVAPKKRKIPTDVDIIENKELGSLKKSNNWGNLEDMLDKTEMDDDGFHEVPISIKETAMDLVNDVMDTVEKNLEVEEEKEQEQEQEQEPEKVVKPEVKERKQNGHVTFNIEPFTISINGNEEKENVHVNVGQSVYVNENGNDSYGTNVPDDVKVSRYPFNSLERPKSDVLKKLISKIEDEPKKDEAIVIEYDPQPISLTFINTESDQTESSQISPVYSSNTNGVNSIMVTSKANIVTISTPSASQPSSIIMIDDENLDFTLQTVDDDDDDIETFEQIEKQIESNEVTKPDEMFVIEMNGKSEGESTPSPPPKSYITEITLKPSPPEKPQKPKPEVNGGRKSSSPTTSPSSMSSSSTTSLSPTNEGKSSSKLIKPHFHMAERRHTETNFAPRNTDIKFTTATYESPLSRSYGKSTTHIDQIRSHFEKSDIPVPVRKSSIGSNKNGSPSKIPVLNSINQRSPPSSNHSSSKYGTTPPVVSVMSIKNQSRSPSD